MNEHIEPLWTGAEILAAAKGVTAAPLPERLTGVSIDSRTAAPGEIFVALSGPNFDGNDFVAAAFRAGAGLAIQSRPVPNGHDPIIFVQDTQTALEAIGAASRGRTSAKIAAITGSVGKTSSKEMLAKVLAPSGATHASAGSYNNHWGVPLSLARMPRDTAYGVFELGMNHGGEIEALTRQVRPHVALVTLIAPAHLEFFPSVEAIAGAKAEIFLGLEAGGVAVLNSDDPQFDLLAAAARERRLDIIRFGTQPKVEARLLSVSVDGDHSAVETDIAGRRLSYRIGLPGTHMALNSVAVLAVAAALGADITLGAETLSSLRPLTGRGQRLEIQVGEGTATLIDESYNASPAAMHAALAVLRSVSPGHHGRRVAVLGDMRELGSAGPVLHEGLAGSIEDAGIDLVYTTGPLMERLFAKLPSGKRGGHAQTAAVLLPLLAEGLRPGDVITVKGSLGTRMADIVRPLLAGYAGHSSEPG